jgi:hypothetical protein
VEDEDGGVEVTIFSGPDARGTSNPVCRFGDIANSSSERPLCLIRAEPARGRAVLAGG